MKNRLNHLLILTAVIAPISLWGQFTTSFSLISKSGVEKSGDLLTSGPEYQKVLEIYNNLIQARGDWRYDPPRLTLSNNEANVAYLEGDGHSIGLEKKAYDLCMSLGEKKGENAIAALMGHELTHFYEKHQWRSSFAETFSDLTVGQKLRDVGILDKVKNETQADYLGGFLAYTAGYGVFDDLPDFYDKIYKAYDLEDTMKGYAELSDRKALAIKSNEQLKDLIEVFEMANLMTAIGHYDQARAFYRYILIHYQGREVYNNLGVLSIMSALRYFSKSELKYRIPLELDFNFGTSRGTDDNIRIALLNQAIRYLNSANSLDPDYAPAYLNKACAYFLLGGEENLKRAEFYAGLEAKQQAAKNEKKFPKTAVHADVLLALIADARGDSNSAKEILTANRDQSSIAHYNLMIMNGQAPSEGKKESPEDEEIDGLDMGAAYDFTRRNRRVRKEQELYGEIDFYAWENEGDLKNSKIYAVKPPSGEGPDVYIHMTKPGYPGKTFDGFEIGTSPLKDVIKEYGEPHFRWGMPDGEIAVYQEILFITNKEGIITRMANFETK